MAKPELGTKRTCPDTGKRFYDLNKQVIVSPYTQNSWPLAYFEAPTSPEKEKEICSLEEETEVKPFVKHTSEEEEEESPISKEEDDTSLDMEYVQEMDLDDDDDFLEQNDTDTDTDVVDMDISIPDDADEN
ncbi:TIGR02300 family protein [Candidatus Liberibacter asiaticus]|uniref:TIGR02300 family protein n=1 Tax=Candidatus Liberibacter asiaticus str. gxpsy TaxID=1174529 RepID=A0ABM5NFP9_LIBAS|nr:TIGR02300 family protein [Candidatus Liberibacter asiaticus]AGH16696.1 hypothetical protein WSI_01630 [Candidatus Liberibacter asiaticus str. gxpsy]ASK52546.1 TIGR02300 family protein [Candidatus Liberibacter asiaticus]KAE9514658.1 hypothetical protein FXW25_01625 [Candidatus Liberibacter asiaticus]KAE9515668.1 hypothetical protein FXW26_01630 [Candidatus Liberibacter asiaticus]KAE9516708.1 hypothetical protein FXW27_01685 [Candidatus Liberibacter asiaticus]